MGRSLPPLIHFTYTALIGMLGGTAADAITYGNPNRALYHLFVALFLLGQSISFYAKRKNSGGSNPNSGEAIPVDGEKSNQSFDANHLSRT